MGKRNAGGVADVRGEQGAKGCSDLVLQIVLLVASIATFGISLLCVCICFAFFAKYYYVWVILLCNKQVNRPMI